MRRLCFGVVVASLALVTPVSAQSLNCAQRSVVVSRLTEHFAEQPRARSILPNGTLFELWSSPNGESWTITKSHPSGMTCVVGAGREIEFLNEVQAEGEPA